MSFGSHVAHLGYFHERFVQRERWITAEANADLVGLCQLLPGPSSPRWASAVWPPGQGSPCPPPC
ncbi:chromate transporter [Parasynechococcus sp.]|uniref:chromate transporter n=1 Tax=Parasynechococcus sp. TaxID=3101203 RepID=UPI0037038DE8